MSAYLSQEELDEKIEEARSVALALPRPTKRNADESFVAFDDEIDDFDGIDDNSMTGDEFLRYNKYELQFVDDEYTPNEKSNKRDKKTAGKKGRKIIPTSTQTSAHSTAMANKAKSTSTANKTKHLKKDMELPVKIDLIELVKQEKSLYNLKDPKYKSRVHKQTVWEKISATLMENYSDMNVEKCKKMWDAVRESTR